MAENIYDNDSFDMVERQNFRNIILQNVNGKSVFHRIDSFLPNVNQEFTLRWFQN